METKNDVIAFLQKQRSDIQERLDSLSGAILGNAFVVVVAGLPIGYDTDKDGNVLRSYGVTPLTTHWFSKQDAEMLATTTKNGHGQTGVAMHIREFLAAEVKNIDGLLSSIPA